jgi:Spy/CpxP family protein refolding chaperone
MKKLILAALLAISVSTFAQCKKEMEKKCHTEKHSPDERNEFGMEKLSSEQHTQLMVKKMTLELDLNAKQQEQVKQIIAEQMVKKEEDKKRTADQIFVIKNKILDEQIAMKNKMKTILSPEQLEKWKAIQETHQAKMKEGRGRNEGKKCCKEKKECNKGKEEKE